MIGLRGWIQSDVVIIIRILLSIVMLDIVWLLWYIINDGVNLLVISLYRLMFFSTNDGFIFLCLNHLFSKHLIKIFLLLLFSLLLNIFFFFLFEICTLALDEFRQHEAICQYLICLPSSRWLRILEPWTQCLETSSRWLLTSLHSHLSVFIFGQTWI